MFLDSIKQCQVAIPNNIPGTTCSSVNQTPEAETNGAGANSTSDDLPIIIQMASLSLTDCDVTEIMAMQLPESLIGFEKCKIER